eukprot:5347663-Prymnesium_polylepis.1
MRAHAPSVPAPPHAFAAAGQRQQQLRRAADRAARTRLSRPPVVRPSGPRSAHTAVDSCRADGNGPVRGVGQAEGAERQRCDKE